MKSLYICLFSNFVVIKITRVLSQLKNRYYHKSHLWYISKIQNQQINSIKKLEKCIFLMDCSTFQNHGKALFLLKKRNTTIHGRPFYLFLPFASIAPIIYGGGYGNHLKTNLR
jgi:hypothetical protein